MWRVLKNIHSTKGKSVNLRILNLSRPVVKLLEEKANKFAWSSSQINNITIPHFYC